MPSEPVTVARPSRLTIAVLGGTGAQGLGLARRLGDAGHSIVIGSRDQSRAAEAAATLSDGARSISAASNGAAVAAADIVIIAVPYEGHHELLISLADRLAGKIVIDSVNPLSFDALGAHPLAVPDGSAAQEAARLLPLSRIVAAFHHVSATLLQDPTVTRIETDVLVLGDDREATDLVQGLCDEIPGMRGIYGGRLRNVGQVEALTANLISVNRRYKGHAGIRITDVRTSDKDDLALTCQPA